MTTYPKEYYAQKARERRALEKKIYTKHAWEKMEGESDKDFRRRFTKRIIFETDEITIIQDPFGKILDLQIKSASDVRPIKENKSEHTNI